MNNFYLVVALITAGISFSTGLISLSAGLHKDGEKVDVVFGLMGLCLFIYFLIPPVGFVLIDKAPYSFILDIKRFFAFTNLALLPWFTQLYTGYRKKIYSFIISAGCFITYMTMALTNTDSAKPLWVMLLVPTVGIAAIFGLYAGYYQIKKGEAIKGRWFLFAMGLFTLLYLLGAFNQLGNNFFGDMLHTKLFFPLNLFPLSFMLIMGIRLRSNVFQKFRLERILNLRDRQWRSLLEKMELIIIELDKTGNVKYVNPYAIKILGFNSANELVDKNWFNNFLPPHEAAPVKSIFLDSIENEKVLPHFKNSIITKNGAECIVNWTSEFIYDDDGLLKGSLSLGTDITSEENAYREIEELKTELEKENLVLKGEDLPAWMHKEIIGESEAIAYAIQKVKQVAATDAPVLLEGETGAGKELFADLVHELSVRNEKSFIKINCGALPAELIESELFGHEKGAFTGAFQSRKGRFELANNGTIFLDEIGELPLALQPKLLRVLQNGTFERVGGQQTIHADVRIVSATNRDLDKEVQLGRFREDLYYRLKVFPITIPSLRNRKEDIPLLVQFFTDRKAKAYGKQIEHISKADMNRLCEYAWPGNVRELKNVIERSVISSETNTLKLDWFYNGMNEASNSSSSLEKIEREHILKILEDCSWKINGETGAASKLAMHPSTLRSRMKKLNISRPA